MSFLVAPDGSKEGWDESELGNERRRVFKNYLRKQVYEDGSSWLRWCEVQYGDDENDDRMIDANHYKLEGEG